MNAGTHTQIELFRKGTKIICRVQKSGRARNFRIAIRKGICTLTIPRKGSEKTGRIFAEQKTDWIFQQMDAWTKALRKISFPSGLVYYKKYKLQARELVETRIRYFCLRSDFTLSSVRIKNHTSQWGSASKKGNLNFNYKIIFLPPELADYIIIHELAHLQELNHSKKFWNIVASFLPDYALRRKELKKYSAS